MTTNLEAELARWKKESRKWERLAKENRAIVTADMSETKTLQEAIRDGDTLAAQDVLDRAIRGRLARVIAPKKTGIEQKLDRILELLDPNYEAADHASTY